MWWNTDNASCLVIIFLSLLARCTTSSPVNGPIRIPLRKNSFLTTPEGIFNRSAFTVQQERTLQKIESGLAAIDINQENGHGVDHEALIGVADLARQFEGFSQRLRFHTHGSDYRQTGSSLLKRQKERLTTQGDQMWTGIVEIGNPRQTFTMDFDTGSADLWVASKECQSSACASKNLYDSSKSQTSTKVDKKFSIKYGDGSSTSGPAFADTVELAGLTVTNQTFASATVLSSSLGSAPSDGILGLAYPSISHLKSPSILANAFHQGSLPQNTFSFNLDSSGSELYLGGADSNKFSGKIEKHPVTRKAYWQLGAAAVYANGEMVGGHSNYETVIDSGTTIMYGPASVVKDIYDDMKGSILDEEAGLWQFPCATTSQLSFSWDGGKKWEVNHSRFNLGNVPDNPSYCIGALSSKPLGLHKDTWLLGDSFMTNVYSVFSADDDTVGFASMA